MLTKPLDTPFDTHFDTLEKAKAYWNKQRAERDDWLTQHCHYDPNGDPVCDPNERQAEIAEKVDEEQKGQSDTGKTEELAGPAIPSVILTGRHVLHAATVGAKIAVTLGGVAEFI